MADPFHTPVPRAAVDREGGSLFMARRRQGARAREERSGTGRGMRGAARNQSSGARAMEQRSGGAPAMEQMSGAAVSAWSDGNRTGGRGRAREIRGGGRGRVRESAGGG